ncbi:MAG: FKBP-type peptidyl-prolyl cis-trans isomerase [Candidatus Rokubacteria bacterium]|nr:FKBP-type peptidyl-prolyl cis-trans isomerase [Candidatus Rokubacteria bacterium]
MRSGIALVLIALLAGPACSKDESSKKEAPAKAAAALTTDEQKTLYALGVALSRNLGQFALTEADLAVVLSGISDGTLNKTPQVEMSTFGPKIQELAKTRSAAIATGEKKNGQAFLDKAAAEPGVQKTASGAIYKEVAAGTGDSPKATDKVKVHYTGTLTDGTVFDSSVQRGQPAEFPLNGVIKCWTEGVQLMKVGGKAKLTCPSDIAYGDKGAPPQIKPGAVLVFDVELLEIEK